MDEMEQRRIKQPLGATTIFKAEMPKHRLQMKHGLVLERPGVNLALILLLTHTPEFLSQTYLSETALYCHVKIGCHLNSHMGHPLYRRPHSIT